MNLTFLSTFFAATCALVLPLIVPQCATAADSSTDLGKTWRARKSPANLRSVAFGAGKFVALGSGKLATSPDGVTWTTRIAPAGEQWNSVVYGKGKFVAVSVEDSTVFTTNVMTSLDGINWTQANDGIGFPNYWMSLIYENGLFVAASNGVFSSNQIMTSADGVSWTARTITGGTPGIYSLAFGNGVFVAVASSNGLSNVTRIHTSTNAIDWTARSIPTGLEDTDLLGITFGNGQFVAVGSNGVIMTSPNGVAWTQRYSNNLFSLSEVRHAEGIYVAFGYRNSNNKSVILTSTDGKTWRPRSSPSSASRVAATYAHGIMIALAAEGTTRNTVITSGAFKVSKSIEFPSRRSTLSNTARSSILSGLGQLDSSFRIKATISIKTDKPLSNRSLARRRALTVLRFLAQQSGYELSVSSSVTKIKTLESSERNTATVVFQYK